MADQQAFRTHPADTGIHIVIVTVGRPRRRQARASGRSTKFGPPPLPRLLQRRPFSLRLTTRPVLLPAGDGDKAAARQRPDGRAFPPGSASAIGWET
jgi:hypothetical protein